MAIQNLVFDGKTLSEMREYSKDRDGKVKVAECLNSIYARLDGKEVDSVKIHYPSVNKFGFTFYSGENKKHAEISISKLKPKIKKYRKVMEDMEYNVSISHMPVDYQLEHRRDLDKGRILLHKEIYKYVESEIIKNDIELLCGARELSYVIMDIIDIKETGKWNDFINKI